MNTLMLFGTATAVTVTGAAALPFVMHRLEGSLHRQATTSTTTPATTPVEAPAVLDEAPGLSQLDVA